MPDLAVGEGGRLHDPRVREHVVERLLVDQRLRRVFDGAWTARDVVAFHTAHKLTLMAHQPTAYAALGRRVASVGRLTASERDAFAREYARDVMRALAHIPTPGRHANVLQHIVGYLKGTLDAADRQALLALIDAHRLGQVPRDVPMTALRQHLRRHPVPYLEGQTYLAPHPREWRARDHVEMEWRDER